MYVRGIKCRFFLVMNKHKVLCDLVCLCVNVQCFLLHCLMDLLFVLQFLPLANLDLIGLGLSGFDPL